MSESPAEQPNEAWISLPRGAGDAAPSPVDTRARFWPWAPPAVLAFASPMIASLAILQPGDASSVMAIFPPWWSAERSVIAASQAGPVLGAGSFPFMVAIKGETPDFVEGLRAAGAVLIVDGRRFPVCAKKL